jgi:prepilin-type N-terminal cleavage/methylation domain-containing protein
MKQNNQGFTLIEMVVVLILISIIAATVFARSITTGKINLFGEAAKIRNHIRYAQSLAMKRNEIWGIKCFGGQYWLFTGADFGDEDNPVRFPDEQTDTISLPAGVTMTAFVLYFDGLGVPYNAYDTVPVTFSPPKIITVTNGTTTRSLTITPETGLITTQ